MNTESLEYFSAGLCGPCPECQSAYGMDEEELTAGIESGEVCESEADYSTSACDLCGTTLGGSRHAAHGRDPETGALVHLEICLDCLLESCE